MLCTRMYDECGLRKSNGECFHKEPICKDYIEEECRPMKEQLEQLATHLRVHNQHEIASIVDSIRFGKLPFMPAYILSEPTLSKG